MDIDQFGRAYRESPQKRPPTHPERREILETPRKWMGFFNDTLHGYLNGEDAPEREAFVEQLHAYYGWSQDHLGPLMARVDQIEDPASIGHVVSEFSFHQLNGPMTYLWHQLLYDHAKRYNPADIADVQTHLAVKMTRSARTLKHILEDRPKGVEKKTEQLKGILTEADSVITMMELMKQHPELIVLPAPERFENNIHKPWRSSDLILIDTDKKQARGIQIKTRTHTQIDVLGYDKRFVSVIDGTHDLGNTFFSTSRADRMVALPGQIAMHLLAGRGLKDAPNALERMDYMQSRLMAQEMTRGRKSFLPQATQHVISRVLPALYLNPEDTFALDQNNERIA